MLDHLNDGCNCEGKSCSKCDELRCIESFLRARNDKNRRGAECAVCRSAKQRAYYLAHAEEIKTRVKRNYQANGSRMARAQQSGRVEEVRAQTREYMQEYRARNAERSQLQSREYYLAHQDKITIEQVIRDARRAARKYGAVGTFSLQEWEDVKARYNYICLCCGKKEPDIKLTPDHVIPLSKVGPNTIENIQPLCMSCNISKRDKTIDYRTS